ncbi:MAG: UDP-N-acetylmuramoyl-tripeptide--D-alanyl-D-alanine ligase [Ruminococcaceae bacterium]|nr:UDP-N-acetylmuramoyl-tripeptide--D-alanyl-D-alanine ligase [Oscillospiraceae bacterium]
MKIKLGLGSSSIGDVCDFCLGELSGDAGVTFEYVCTDSREADENTLFVATRGERVDGHDYIASAQKLGCKCFLCEYIPQGVSEGSSFCVVKNSVGAFSSLAAGYRRDNRVDTVAITGSVGKTTTKELTSRVLSEKYKLYCTEGNFNSVIGMPMSMMEMGPECDMAVFEMGMSGFGEISLMSRVATPKIAAVTNIGTSHLEYLKTRENIAKAKLEIAQGLCEGGILLLNGDEPLLRQAASQMQNSPYKVMFACIESEGDFCARNIRFGEDATVFDIKYDNVLIEDICVPAIGRHIAFDALFAAAIGLLCGLTREQINDGLSKYIAGKYRQKIYDVRGVRMISDCYNASPESVKGALGVLEMMKADRRIAVLGDMKELGATSEELHRSVGAEVAAKNIDMLFAVGEYGRFIAEGAKASGMDEGSIFVETDESAQNTVSELNNILREGDAVLIKASRSMKFEKIVEAIENNG